MKTFIIYFLITFLNLFSLSIKAQEEGEASAGIQKEIPDLSGTYSILWKASRWRFWEPSRQAEILLHPLQPETGKGVMEWKEASDNETRTGEYQVSYEEEPEGEKVIILSDGLYTPESTDSDWRQIQWIIPQKEITALKRGQKISTQLDIRGYWGESDFQVYFYPEVKARALQCEEQISHLNSL